MATSLSTAGPPSKTRAHNPNSISIGSAVFAQGYHRVSLHFTMGRRFSPQNCPFPWGIWTPSNTWFPGPTQVLNPNGISIGAAVFAGLTGVTDRQADRPTDHATRSVTIGRIYVCSTAMRPETCLIATTNSLSSLPHPFSWI